MHFGLAMMSNFQRETCSRKEWLTEILAMRDNQFYATQANIAVAEFEKFALRTVTFIGRRNRILLDNIAGVAGLVCRSGNSGDLKRFRTGVLFAIELLWRIEENTPVPELRPN